MAKTETFSFNINERGENSGTAFNWNFTAKRMLTIRDRITKDAVRRQIVGDRPQDAEPNTLMRAEMLAYCQVSITEAPKGWRDTGNGLDLYDDNVLVKVYETIVEEHNKAVDEADKAAEEAKEKLRKVARSKKAEAEEEPETK